MCRFKAFSASNTNALIVGNLTHGLAVSNMKKDVPEFLWVKGWTLARVERMQPLLSSYLDRAAARFLESGFADGFIYRSLFPASHPWLTI